MMAHMLPPELLAEQARLMESYGAECVYVVDSAGALLPDGAAARVHALKNALSIQVGIHAHNNLGVAIGNTLAAIFRDRLRASNPNVEDREHALSIATMQSYAPGEDDFSALVSNLGNYQYDAILIADALPRAGALIREIRMRGIDTAWARR